MSPSRLFRPGDWDDIELVVFDVDGTLYCQDKLRLRMARDLIVHSLLQRELNVASVLRTYRTIRERLARENAANFEPRLIAQTAAATSNSADTVRAIVTEWIEQRPLAYLADCAYPGLSELFAGLRRHGKRVGAVSDYPVQEKLTRLGLAADHVVSAADAHVGALKPNPRGLIALMAAAQVDAHATLIIGDRPEHDGIAARRAGARALIRSSRPIRGWQTFRRFDGALFAPVLA